MNPRIAHFLMIFGLVLSMGAGCRDSQPAAATPRLVLSAIPDQDPEKLQRLYGGLAAYLSNALGVQVEYKPMIDYKAAVTAFKVGDLQLVWFGGLTGVQARLQVPAAESIVQRDIDEKFRSVFIANAASGISSLADLKGRTFTFGSESSTSGRLMPQYFLEQSGVHLNDFKGKAGFSGSHDKTIELVTAGSFEAGAVNEQVWQKRLENKTVDTSRVTVISTTPTYHDYHWLLHPEAAKRLGADFKGKLIAAFTALSTDNPEQAKILDLFGAKRFIPTSNENYRQIEEVGRATGLIVLPETAANQR
jgi:phosphonate transport system substrate-binding protein